MSTFQALSQSFSYAKSFTPTKYPANQVLSVTQSYIKKQKVGEVKCKGLKCKPFLLPSAEEQV